MAHRCCRLSTWGEPGLPTICAGCATQIDANLDAPQIHLGVLFGGRAQLAPIDAAAVDTVIELDDCAAVVRHHRALFNSPDIEDKVRAYRSLLHWSFDHDPQRQSEVDERAREIARMHFERVVELICQINGQLVQAQFAIRGRDLAAYQRAVEGAMDRCCRLPQVGFSTAARLLSFVDPQRFGGLDPRLAHRIEVDTEGRWSFEWFGPAGHRLTAASAHNRACFVRWLAHLHTMRRCLDAQGGRRIRVTGGARALRAIDVELALATG